MRRQYRKKRNKHRKVAYFEKVDTLPDSQFLSCAIVVPFYHNKVLVQRTGKKSVKFPSCRIEEGESLHKTVRRELHKQTGAVLHDHFFLGQFAVYGLCNNAYLPIYAGRISRLERRIIVDHELLNLNTAAKQFAPSWEKPNLDYFLQTLKHYRKKRKL